jgi:hypothetical protein
MGNNTVHIDSTSRESLRLIDTSDYNKDVYTFGEFCEYMHSTASLLNRAVRRNLNNAGKPRDSRRLVVVPQPNGYDCYLRDTSTYSKLVHDHKRGMPAVVATNELLLQHVADLSDKLSVLMGDDVDIDLSDITLIQHFEEQHAGALFVDDDTPGPESRNSGTRLVKKSFAVAAHMPCSVYLEPTAVAKHLEECTKCASGIEINSDLKAALKTLVPVSNDDDLRGLIGRKWSDLGLQLVPSKFTVHVPKWLVKAVASYKSTDGYGDLSLDEFVEMTYQAELNDLNK